jgi:hypothetical protein
MRITRFQVTAILATASLIVPAWPALLNLGDPPHTHMIGFADRAISPPLVAGAFHEGGYDQARRIRTIHKAQDVLADKEPPCGSAACIREAWSARIMAFAGTRKTSRRIPASVQVPSPERVQKLIRGTRTQKEALQLLRDELGWSMTSGTLSKFMKRHALRADWQRHQLDALEVQRLIRTTNSSREALERLTSELGWSPSSGNLSDYMTRHELIAPWSRRRNRRNDPLRVQEVIRATMSRQQAVQLLQKELGWSPTTGNLSQYMKRHGLSAPWRYPDAQRVQEILRASRTRQEAVQLLQKELGWSTTPENLSRFIQRHGLTVSWLWRGRGGEVSIDAVLFIAATAGLILSAALFPSWIGPTALTVTAWLVFATKFRADTGLTSLSRHLGVMRSA